MAWVARLYPPPSTKARTMTTALCGRWDSTERERERVAAESTSQTAGICREKLIKSANLWNRRSESGEQINLWSENCRRLPLANWLVDETSAVTFNESPMVIRFYQSGTITRYLDARWIMFTECETRLMMSNRHTACLSSIARFSIRLTGSAPKQSHWTFRHTTFSLFTSQSSDWNLLTFFWTGFFDSDKNHNPFEKRERERRLADQGASKRVYSHNQNA